MPNPNPNPNPNPKVATAICNLLACDKAIYQETVQKLWSDYGEITRYQIQKSGLICTLIAKVIKNQEVGNQPRGWNTPFAHQRKITSYQVEERFYQHWAHQCPKQCQVPEHLGNIRLNEKKSSWSILLLSDLDASGFTLRKQSLTTEQAKIGLSWLAHFHAVFLQDEASQIHQQNWPQGLWPIGTYWHLATRTEEYAAMPEEVLKSLAHNIDKELNRCRFKTLVHGDAKVANFCFNQKMTAAAMVDFQYVGAGCGIKDVIYFIGSCMSEAQCERDYDNLIAFYFNELANKVSELKPNIVLDDLLAEWSYLTVFAWADFQRFLIGWAPDHQKLNRFMAKKTDQALSQMTSI